MLDCNRLLTIKSMVYFIPTKLDKNSEGLLWRNIKYMLMMLFIQEHHESAYIQSFFCGLVEFQ